MRKTKEVYFLACIVHFSNFSTAEVFDEANAQNVLKCLQVYVFLHGIPSARKIDQANCHIGQQIKAFRSHNNIHLIKYLRKKFN